MDKQLLHPFPPVFDENSKVLILGSFPSVKSRENEFYYGHAQNRFWRVLAAVFSESVPQSIGEKTDMLHRHGIALWDVVKSCEITGSSDSSIKNVIANDLNVIFSSCSIETLFANGKTAQQLYVRELLPRTQREIVYLPSTSPANASFSLERLTDCWRAVAR